MSGLGRFLVVGGLVLAAIGLLVLAAERFGVRLGRLPGDVAIERGNLRFYFPIVTSIVASVVLTLVLWLLGRR
jgi:hypothetical protein